MTIGVDWGDVWWYTNLSVLFWIDCWRLVCPSVGGIEKSWELDMQCFHFIEFTKHARIEEWNKQTKQEIKKVMCKFEIISTFVIIIFPNDNYTLLTL